MTFGVPELGARQGVFQARLRICSGGLKLQARLSAPTLPQRPRILYPTHPCTTVSTNPTSVGFSLLGILPSMEYLCR